ncbi:hypothetical protein, partial [Roseiflexus castenholzii]|uniref:hypothetical protein n=1 Tax=Roseiflexus castenholzii TaxID=120962 RepID=UPI003C7AEDAD
MTTSHQGDGSTRLFGRQAPTGLLLFLIIFGVARWRAITARKASSPTVIAAVTAEATAAVIAAVTAEATAAVVAAVTAEATAAVIAA